MQYFIYIYKMKKTTHRLAKGRLPLATGKKVNALHSSFLEHLWYAFIMHSPPHFRSTFHFPIQIVKYKQVSPFSIYLKVSKLNFYTIPSKKKTLPKVNTELDKL